MSKTGLDVKLHGGKASGGNDDEFAKGIVAKPSEQEAIQGEGELKLGETTLLYGGGLFKKESTGLTDGVSDRQELNQDSSEPNYNYDVDPMTGNAPERKVGRSNNMEVTGKRGNKFSIGEV